MDRAGMNCSDLCKSLNLSGIRCGYSTVSDWYHGKKFPRIDKIAWLSEFFGVNVCELVSEHLISPENTVPGSIPRTTDEQQMNSR